MNTNRTPATTHAHSETPAEYRVDKTKAIEQAKQDDELIISLALAVLERRVIGQPLTAPSDVKHYLRLRYARAEREEFAVVLLDGQHHVITCETLFTGTLTQTSVYPREVVRCAMRHNAAAVILCHNHPSGVPEPSRADEHLTQALKSALQLVDVRVLDHIIVATSGTVSLAERGLL